MIETWLTKAVVKYWRHTQKNQKLCSLYWYSLLKCSLSMCQMERCLNARPRFNRMIKIKFKTLTISHTKTQSRGRCVWGGKPGWVLSINSKQQWLSKSFSEATWLVSKHWDTLCQRLTKLREHRLLSKRLVCMEETVEKFRFESLTASNAAKIIIRNWRAHKLCKVLKQRVKDKQQRREQQELDKVVTEHKRKHKTKKVKTGVNPSSKRIPKKSFINVSKYCLQYWLT